MTTKLCVLLIEDDDVDVETIYRVAPRYVDELEIVRVSTARRAVIAMLAEGDKPLLNLPYVVVLDLNLPGMSGVEFLQEVRTDARLAQSPVFVLTGSNDERLKRQALQHHVLAYVSKSKFTQDVNRCLRLLLLYLRHRRIYTKTTA